MKLAIAFTAFNPPLKKNRGPEGPRCKLLSRILSKTFRSVVIIYLAPQSLTGSIGLPSGSDEPPFLLPHATDTR